MSTEPNALEIMLTELRRLGCNRGEPCGVHQEPQWTCGFCLHNLLAELATVKAERQADDAFYKLTVAQRDAAWKELEAVKAERDEIVGMIQRRLQPSGSPPPGDARTLVAWIIGMRVDELTQLEAELTRLRGEQKSHGLHKGDCQCAMCRDTSMSNY